jgi:hypothetical protein
LKTTLQTSGKKKEETSSRKSQFFGWKVMQEHDKKSYARREWQDISEEKPQKKTLQDRTDTSTLFK